jgi:hypothetical protein
MGEYDVTAGQYCQMLNAVAATDTYGLYNAYMAPVNNFPASTGGAATFGITQSGSPGNYTYSVTGNPNFPMNYVPWGDAARFCNWLENGQPTAPEGPGSTETGSYTLNGDLVYLTTETRNAGARYVIPTEDEWYKAAYYKGGGTNAGYWLYPTRSNSVPSNVMSSIGTNNANYCTSVFPSGSTDPVNYLTPVGYFAGSPGPYGTFDQGGDLYQWNEALKLGEYRGQRGGAFNLSSEALQSSFGWYNLPSPAFEAEDVGFRVVLVPEPATLSLLALGGLLVFRRRRALRRLATVLLAVGMLSGVGRPASADVFNLGGTFDPTTGQWTGNASLQFVTVGDPGNAADTTGYGAVGYTSPFTVA